MTNKLPEVGKRYKAKCSYRVQYSAVDVGHIFTIKQIDYNDTGVICYCDKEGNHPFINSPIKLDFIQNWCEELPDQEPTIPKEILEENTPLEDQKHTTKTHQLDKNTPVNLSKEIQRALSELKLELGKPVVGVDILHNKAWNLVNILQKNLLAYYNQQETATELKQRKDIVWRSIFSSTCKKCGKTFEDSSMEPYCQRWDCDQLIDKGVQEALEEVKRELKEWEDDCFLSSGNSQKPLDREAVISTFRYVQDLVNAIEKNKKEIEKILEDVKEPKFNILRTQQDQWEVLKKRIERLEQKEGKNESNL